MKNVAISETATMPGQVRSIETGDTLVTATFDLPSQDIADAIGALKARTSGGRRALHGAISTDGAGNASILGGGGGYTVTISGTAVRILFTIAKADAFYSVVCTARRGTNMSSAQYDDPTTAQVDVYAFDNTNAAINLSATAHVFSFRIDDAE